jgi:hypothetical protein
MFCTRNGTSRSFLFSRVLVGHTERWSDLARDAHDNVKECPKAKLDEVVHVHAQQKKLGMTQP